MLASVSVIRHHFHQQNIYLIRILCMHSAPSSIVRYAQESKLRDLALRGSWSIAFVTLVSPLAKCQEFENFLPPTKNRTYMDIYLIITTTETSFVILNFYFLKPQAISPLGLKGYSPPVAFQIAPVGFWRLPRSWCQISQIVGFGVLLSITCMYSHHYNCLMFT